VRFFEGMLSRYFSIFRSAPTHEAIPWAARICFS
jgi:hypothetical protein